MSSTVPFIDVQIPLEQIEPDSKCFISQTNGERNRAEKDPILKILRKIRPEWEIDQIEIEVGLPFIGLKKLWAKLIYQISHNSEKLIFRIFGAGSERLIDRQSEFENLELLAMAGIAPTVYAKFQNGLVCGFQPGECLTTQSIREPEVADKISKKMAQMHRIPMEIGKNMKSMFSSKGKDWLDRMPSKFPSGKIQRQFDQYFAGMDLYEQFACLQTGLDKIQSPLVFAHNDLLIYNILLDSKSGEVHFIDYEYAGPNYQLFDIGNHFCEYAGLDDPDYERSTPNEVERRHFLSRYFFHFNGTELSDCELQKLLRDVPFFEAASHLFWVLWAIHQAQISTLSFDYMQYAVCRHRQFIRMMTRFGI